MGVLKGVDVSLDGLIGYSKLQDVLELLLEHLNAQDLALQPLQAAAAELKDGQQATLQQLHAATERLEGAESRLDGHQAAIQPLQAAAVAASEPQVAPEQLQELTSRLDNQDELIRKLQADLSRQAEAQQGADEAASRQTQQSQELAQQSRELTQQSQELLAKLQAQEAALSQLQECVGGPSGVSSLLEEVRREVEGIQSKEQAREMAMPKPGEELPPEIRTGIATALGPLEAAIAAIDARIESQVVVRLEHHEGRLDAHERLHANLLAATEEGLERPSAPPAGGTAWAEGEEQVEGRHGAIIAVKQEISDLARKLTDVTAVLSELESQVQEQGGAARMLAQGGQDPDPGRVEYAEMLNKVSKQLEDRVESLEGRLADGSTGDMSQFGDSLKQVQSVARNLEGIVSGDVQPTLDTHSDELRRFSGELSNICRRINDMVSKSSTATTTGLPHCLACYDPRKQASNKVIIGRDGKAYLQGNSAATMNIRTDVSSYSAWPPDDRGGGMVNALCKPRLGENRVALQGGAGAPLRKYKIPVGGDGVPTWSMVKGSNAAMSTVSVGCLPAAVERGRGAQRGLPMPCSRPMSSPGLHGSLSRAGGGGASGH